MMFVRRPLVVLIASLILCVFVAGCSSDDERLETASSDAADAPAGEAEYRPINGDYDEVAAQTDDREVAATIGASVIDRRVIRSGELELTVSDVPAAVRFARELVPDFDGYVESSSTRTISEGLERAELSLEVPSHTFDQVIDALRNGPHVIRVEHESTDSRDVTEEYVDLNSQLSNLQATEERFVELLNEAHSIDEILRVESELSRIRGDIERIQGRINYLEQRTDYSRIVIWFLPDTDEDLLIGGQPFTPGESAQNAWEASLEFVGTVGNAIITIVVFFWWAWPLLAILAAVGIQYRRKRREREVAAA